MAERAEALLLKFPGTNCDGETARALRLAGFQARTVPVSLAARESFEEIDLVVLPGGFSYGDYVMAGRLASLEISLRLGDALHRFHDGGGHVLGICNGFQILMQLGLLPAGSLVENLSERFICRWVELERTVQDSPFLDGLPSRFELPIANGEGRFITANPEQAEEYVERGLAAVRYAGDVNGSYARIAGLQSASRRVLGLMPHPERFVFARQHYDPDWNVCEGRGWGYFLFRSIREHVRAAAAV
ncbi:MAG TPA: phosphoribosylformylglycinamidine synthase subunit PurQ [Verrucomicrobiales bacterium]|nr:phosphoribosylformylglycinamidine synthase subunit PurQ [Verrucomicrobiales bacterium]